VTSFSADRDENAAENIRRQGILKLKAEGLSVSAHGGGVSVEHLACPQPPLKWEASAFRREEQSLSYKLYA